MRFMALLRWRFALIAMTMVGCFWAVGMARPVDVLLTAMLSGFIYFSCQTYLHWNVRKMHQFIRGFCLLAQAMCHADHEVLKRTQEAELWASWYGYWWSHQDYKRAIVEEVRFGYTQELFWSLMKRPGAGLHDHFRAIKS